MSTPTTRSYGAQSMTAPLRRGAGQAAGSRFRRGFDGPTVGFLHRVDLAAARRQHDALCSVLADLGVDRARAGPRTARARTRCTSSTRCWSPTPARSRCARASRAARARRPTWRRGRSPRGSPSPAASRRPARSTAATPSGCGRTCSASAARCARTSAGAEQLAALVGGDVARLRRALRDRAGECLHLLSVISPVADDLAVVFLPQLPAGLYELLGELRRGGWWRCPRRRCRRSAATCSRCGRGGGAGRGQPGAPRGLLDRGLRGAHLPGVRDRRQRVGRPHLPDPADPARMKNLSPAELAAVGAVDRDRIADDLAALVAIPSLTGDEADGADRGGAAHDHRRAGRRAPDRRRPGRARRRPRLPRHGGARAPRCRWWPAG